jgi:cephalosporin hydroxylase
MTAKTLEQLYSEHEGKISYKWSAYLSHYQRIFEPYSLQPIRLMEIGIQNGGSLEIWSKYFINAPLLLGCDIDPNCGLLNYEDSRISVVIGDVNSNEIQEKITALSTEFDIIIDDGSHSSGDIIKSFCKYFGCLTDDGVYLAEDLHASYWQEYQGGLYDPYSSISFFKRLADIVNYDHWGIEKTRGEFMRGFVTRYGLILNEEILEHIHSIEFINSVCVVRKNKPAANSLGYKFITGTQEAITDGHLKMNLSSPSTPLNQSNNRWSTVRIPPEEELSLRLIQLTERDEEIARLNQNLLGHIAALKTIEEMSASSSWRITAPLRFIADAGRQLSRMLSQNG